MRTITEVTLICVYTQTPTNLPKGTECEIVFSKAAITIRTQDGEFFLTPEVIVNSSKYFAPNECD